MARKRRRPGSHAGAKSHKWDSLPWKAIQPTLERDDGWKNMAGDEQALLYTLEEISGSDYDLQGGSRGGSHMVVRGVDQTDAARGDPKGRGAVKSKLLEGDALSVERLLGTDTTKWHKDKGAKSANAASSKPAVLQHPSALSLGAESTVTSSTGSAREVNSAPGERRHASKDASAKKGTANLGDEEVAQPRRKKRRGQGKKKRAAHAGSVAKDADEESNAKASGISLPAMSPPAEGGFTKDGHESTGVGSRSTHTPQQQQQQQEQQQQRGQSASEETAEIIAGAGNGTAGQGSETKTTRKKRDRVRRGEQACTAQEGRQTQAGAAKHSRGDARVGPRTDWELGEDAAAMMAPWLYVGVELHPALLWHLHRQGFCAPTPIQKRVLPKAILGRKDVIGAAETGSGKTLAFGLPVLSEILTRRDARASGAEDVDGEGDEIRAGGGGGGSGLQALVLCPTRELALQVAAHLKEVVVDTGVAVVAVVGGLAEVKQERQLSRRPEVVVATPGRFWELAGTHAHLSRLETLRHLVVDEVDRMLERGHYPELQRLFSLLDRAEGRAPEAASTDVALGDDASSIQMSRSNPPWLGGNGVADARILGDVKGDATKEESDDADRVERPLAVSLGRPAAVPATAKPRRHARQTYVFSATLTLGTSTRQRKRKAGAAKNRGGAKVGEEDDPLAKIMKRVGVRGDPAVIDMGRRTLSGPEELRETVGGETGSAISAGAAGVEERGGASALPALPSTLRLCSVRSLQMEKDVHAYLFCANYPGRTLIFVNAIAGARRLAVLLGALNIPATPLHAQMQQRQRLKSLDRFTSDPKAVMIATDVAARGLDIPKVEHVVHYDAARSAEVFIHRAGRTARAGATGLSLSIVAPRDDANHRQTCSVLGFRDGMQAFPTDVRLVDRARERVGSALKVLNFQQQLNKVSATNDFFKGLSKDADIVMDGDLLMEDDNFKSETGGHARASGLGRKGKRHAARLAAEARRALQVSLSQPLHSDRRKLIPVAQALTAMKKESQRTAAGDLLQGK